MIKTKITPRDHELVMADDDLIISKTDLTGRIIYANDIFKKFSGYEEWELLDQQHSIVRHPDMPRAIFKILWDVIKGKREIFAYVKNLTKDGSYYWTFANISPDLDLDGNIVSYFSVRRKPNRSSLEKIRQLYAEMLKAEKKVPRRESIDASMAVLNDYLKARNADYDTFIHQI